MRLLLRMAWRNLWRKRRRTLISLSAAGLGLLLVIFYSGLVSGMMGEAKNQLDNTGMGHVEVYAKGWRPRRPPDVALPDPRALLASLSLPKGAQAGFRVVARGLATSAHGGQGVTLFGVDPALERELSAHLSDIRQGGPLEPDDLRGVLVGEKLAEELRLEVGHKLKVMVQRADGEMGADLFRVRGIFHSISAPISRATIYVNAAAAQKLLGVGEVAHQLVIQLEVPAQADAVAASIKAKLGERAEVVTYTELMPAMKQIEDMMDKIILGMTLFVYLLVGMGILNTSLMSVLERTREFGVMRALGERPSRVVALVLAESFWIAVLAVAIGGSLGLLATWAGSRGTVLDFRGMGESIEWAGSLIRTRLRTGFDPASALEACGLVFVLTLLVGLYPAWRVSKLEPAKALRAN